QVPDIFHCGHTHTVGVSKYRNVLLINSGTWQSQTPYQKKRDINPTAGCATLVELSELKTKILDFGNTVGA
ncbi:MAG: DNA polymerase II small subunit, partial [Euryarchaeota archaeon]|nr:DNA polymerase II small subunit [Euryarchaeota archaeon]